MERAARADFQVLIVDRDDIRRGEMMQWLTELGFRHVTVASAPQSAATFADASPPHIVLVGIDMSDVGSEAETRETVLRIRKISRETQAIIFSSAGQEGEARGLAMSVEAWDWLTIPAIADGDTARRAAVEFCLDRACSRLFAQFETEAWRDRYTQLSSTGVGESEDSRQRLIRAVREFARLKEFDTVVTETCRLFAAAVGGTADAIYLRWIPIRNAFVVQHCDGVNAGDFSSRKGLGFSPADGTSAREALLNLKSFPELRRFLKDVFRIENYTVLLHGTPDEPSGLFVISGSQLHVGAIQNEIEATTHLFDLTWGRIQALRDRHTLERVDRGTGLPNKKAFQESLDYEFARARRLRHPLSVALVTVSAPQVNLGEMLGVSFDSVLKVVGSSLRRTLRGTDMVARFGKDQFALIMPHTPVAEAAAVIDRLCRMTERLNLPALELLHVNRLKVQAALSEYPSLVRDSEGMVASFLDLDWEDTPQRVRVIEAPPGFEPEYSVRFGEGLSL